MKKLKLTLDKNEFPISGVKLGATTIHRGQKSSNIDVRLSDIDRLRHLYILGKTGTGKTNLLKSMASQDVKVEGRGVTVIDPHGDLVEFLLHEIPNQRIKEVTLIDLYQTDFLPVLNPLDIDKTDLNLRDRTIQEVIWLMRSRVYHEFTGPRFDDLTRLVLLTMFDKGYPVPPSLVEISRILMDEALQLALFHLVEDEDLKEKLRFLGRIKDGRDYGDLIHWVTSKFDDIANDSTLRVVFGGAKSSFKIKDTVNNNGILLVRIPESVIGSMASDLIGSLVLLQLRMAIMKRGIINNPKNYHYVYVDEFQNFANSDFFRLIAEGRKFGVSFALANQNLEQLREFRTYTGLHEQRLINAILGNVGNLVAFNMGAIDASLLSNQFSLSVRELMQIDRYEAVAKLVVNGFETQPFTLRTEEAVSGNNSMYSDHIMDLRISYCVNPTQVLDEINGRVNKIKIDGSPRLSWDPRTSSEVSEDSNEPVPETKNEDQTNKDIEVAERIITIKNCPKCHQAHKYSFEVQRSPLLGLMAPSQKRQYFTRIFTCPSTNENFEARFSLNLEESASIKLKGILFKA